MLTTLSPALNTPSGDLPVAPQGTSTERRMDMAAAVEGEICGRTAEAGRRMEEAAVQEDQATR